MWYMEINLGKEMTLFTNCFKCGVFIWRSTPHKCPPIYEIQDTEYRGEDDLEEIYSHSMEEAAKKYTEQWDQDEPMLHDGGTTTHEFNVRKQGDTDWTRFSGWGEATIDYHASRVEE